MYVYQERTVCPLTQRQPMYHVCAAKVTWLVVSPPLQTRILAGGHPTHPAKEVSCCIL